MTPDPKPPPRVRDGALLKALHREWRECALCGGTYGLTLHHIKRRSQGGGDTIDNLVMLCMGPGTSDCHGKLHSGDDDIREDLREWQAKRSL